jgi:hypothetical protein
MIQEVTDMSDTPLPAPTCSYCSGQCFHARGAIWCPACDLATPEELATRIDRPDDGGGVGAVVAPVSPPMIPAGA